MIMIISPQEKQAFAMLLGHPLSGVVTNRGVYDYHDKSLMVDELALTVHDRKTPGRDIHYLVMNGHQIGVKYLGECGRLRVKYFAYAHVPLSQRGATLVQTLDSKFCFAYTMEKRIIRAIKLYGHRFKGTIKEIDPIISMDDLNRGDTFDTILDDYTLNIIELSHDNFSTIIRIEESGFYVFVDCQHIDEYLLDMNLDKYDLLLEM